jgi:hypothetical protein
MLKYAIDRNGYRLRARPYDKMVCSPFYLTERLVLDSLQESRITVDRAGISNSSAQGPARGELCRVRDWKNPIGDQGSSYNGVFQTAGMSTTASPHDRQLCGREDLVRPFSAS